MHEVYVLEGLPGAGKTSLTRRLAYTNVAARVGEVLDETNKELVGEQLAGKDTAFFIQSDIRKHKLASELAGSSRVVLDRGFPSTVIWCECLEDHARREEVLRAYYTLHSSLRPAAYIYLEVDPFVGLHRKQKTPLAADQWSFLPIVQQAQRAYESFFAKELVPVYKVNAMESSCAVYAAVQSIIRSHNVLLNK
jgi:thymidylate kinase